MLKQLRKTLVFVCLWLMFQVQASAPLLDLRFDTQITTQNPTVYDYGQYLHVGTSSNITSLSGVGNTCYSVRLDGNDYISIDPGDKLEVGKNGADFTVAFWLKLDSTQPYEWRSIIHKGNNNGERTFSAWLHQSSFYLHPPLTTTASGNDYSESNSPVPYNQWVHIALVKKNSQYRYYFNGSRNTTHNLRGLTVANDGPLTIGKVFHYNGIRGQFDEMVVFDYAFNKSQVQALRQNNLNGKNWDGSTKTCQAPPSANMDPVLDLRFDEAAWFATGDVKDSSGNNYHATAFGSQPSPGKFCNAADLRDTGIHDYIKINEDVLDGAEDFTLSFWSFTPEINHGMSLLSAATAAENNEIIFWLPNATQFNPHIKGSSPTTLNITSLANYRWQHLVWVRNGDQNCLYLNKQLQGCTTLPNQALDVQSLILGQEQDAVGGGFAANQAMEGMIDELLVFRRALSQNDIDTIYDNQNNGLNYDGSEREYSCDIVGWWQFEYDYKDSTTVSPVDLSPVNSPNFGSSNPGAAQTIGNLSTCNYIKFDGSNYLRVGDSDTFNFDEVTASAWIYPTQTPTGGLGSLVSKDSYFEFHLNRNLQLFWWWMNEDRSSAHSFSSNTSIPLNTWTHVAVTYARGDQRMYINGQLVGSASYTDGLDNTPCDFLIGTDSATGSATVCGGIRTDRNFVGHMDEVRIYSSAKTTAQIQEDMLLVHNSCVAPPVTHYQLNIPNSTGLTCQPLEMTLQACLNESCTETYNNSVQVNLSPNNSNWTPGTALSFTGSQALSYSQTNPGTYSFGISSSSPAADLKCRVAGVETPGCQVSFQDTGFLFSNSQNSSPAVTEQVSGQTFNNVYVEAVKTNDNSGACESVYSGNQTVNMRVNCTSPGGCFSGAEDNQMVFTLNNAILEEDSGWTSVSLNFNASTGKAHLGNLNYSDAGRIQLQIEDTTPNGDVLNGQSNEFVVRPDHIFIDISENPNADDESDPVFRKTDQPFALSFIARNNANQVTRNFNYSSTLSLSHTLQSPTETGTQVGRLNGTSGALSLTSVFNSGQSGNHNVRWDQVGIMALQAQINGNSYLGHSQTITGNRDNIGRFVPDRFVLDNVVQSSACTAANSFTYLGQNFSLGFRISAQNAAGEIMKNYRGGYAKGSLLITAENNDINFYQPSSYFSGRLNLQAIPNWVEGEITLPAGNVNEIARHSAVFAEYFSSLDFIIEVEDGESSTYTQLDGLNQRAEEFATCTTNCSGKSIGSSMDFRFGRAILNDNFGSESDPLLLPMYIEHWNGSSFVVNQDDSCSSFNGLVQQNSPSSPILSNLQVGASPYNFVNGALNGANGQYFGPSNSVIQAEMEWLVPNYLLFDWHDGDGFNDNPTGRLEFGQFRGNDRVIYKKENF